MKIKITLCKMYHRINVMILVLKNKVVAFKNLYQTTEKVFLAEKLF